MLKQAIMAMLLLFSGHVFAYTLVHDLDQGVANGFFMHDCECTTHFRFHIANVETVSGRWEMTSRGDILNGRRINLNNFGLFDELTNQQVNAGFSDFIDSPDSIGSLMTATLNPGTYRIEIDSGSWGWVDSTAQLSSNQVPLPAAVWLFGSGLGILGGFRSSKHTSIQSYNHTSIQS
jgi:hypothetical protein